jgi:hypothetical protein
MAISKLVTGTPFDRPAITFSTKSADSNLQKASSSLLTNKSSMGDLADSMSRLNIQLTQLQKVSNEIMKSIASVLKTIAKVDRDMTGRFRTLNKELASSRTEFTRSLAYITPSLTGGAGAAISGAALGAAAPAAAADAIPPSGNSTWDAFVSFLKIAAPLLLSKIGKKLATMAILAATGIGWIGVAVGLALSIGDAIELYKLWKQFKNEKPDQAEIDGAMASYNKSQPPVGAPQGAQLTDMSMSGETGAFAEAAGSKAQGGTGSPQGGSVPATDMSIGGETGSFGAARQSAAAPQPMRRPTEAAPTDMSISGETGAFGAARQSAAAPQPMRRPTETAPTKAAGVPIVAAPPIDPHSKSRAMFEAATEAEKSGGDGRSLFFAADKQRTLELANIKSAAAAPGAPVEVKKAAAKSLQDPTNKATQGRGGGHANGESMFGRGGGHMTGETMFGRGGGHMTGESTLGRGGGDHKSPLLDPIQGPMQSMADKQTAAIAGGMYDKDVADTSGENVDAQRRQLESTAMNDARQQSGESLARIGAPVPDKTGETTTGRAITSRNLAAGIIGPEASMEAYNKRKPTATPKAPEPTQIEPEGDESAGYKGKAGKILQQNMNDYNVVNKSAGGDQTVTPNIPLSATNTLLNRIFGRQQMENHQ